MRRWDLIDTFVNVVDAGSFSSAAKRLGVSKSLVSRKVAQLEQELGTQLLFRTTRRINPTEAGYELFEKCSRLLSGLEEAGESVRQRADVPRGHLRMAAADWLGERYLAACAADFNLRYPQVKVDVHITTSSVVDLVAERYDLALHYGNGSLENSSLRARKICEIPHVVCASPEYIRRHGAPREIEDLKHHNCLVSEFELCTTWRFKRGDSYVDIDLDGTWRSNNGQALLSAALQGLGICRLPLLYVLEYLNERRLVTLLDEYRAGPVVIWVLYPNTRYVPAKVRLFIDFYYDWIHDIIAQPTYTAHQ
jgi:DNA-binding transcriptional LysR family regulator